MLVAVEGSETLHARSAGFEVRDTLMVIARGKSVPYILYRKPLDAPLVQNVLTHGAGGIDIDGCRVAGGPGYEEEVRRNVEAFAKLQAKNPGWKNSSTYAPNVEGALKGRWPPNVVLGHSEGCSITGFRRMNAPVLVRHVGGARPWGNAVGVPHYAQKTGDAEGMEQIAIWSCARGCPILSMQSASTDTGMASRFFPQFEAGPLGEEALRAWQTRLLCMEGEPHV